MGQMFNQWYGDTLAKLPFSELKTLSYFHIQQANEAALIQYATKMLEMDFEIEHEVEGKHLLSGTKVRIDMMLKPRQHLNLWEWSIGLEVKTFYKSTHDLQKSAWQAITYSDSTFEGYGRPDFVLIYPSFYHGNESHEYREKLWTPHEHGTYYGIAKLLHYAKCGFLRIFNKYDAPVWEMTVGFTPVADAWNGVKKGKGLEGMLKRNYGSL